MEKQGVGEGKSDRRVSRHLGLGACANDSGLIPRTVRS